MYIYVAFTANILLNKFWTRQTFEFTLQSKIKLLYWV